MKILSVDLESTGLDPFNNSWITGSLGILDFDTLETLDELELESRPTDWSHEAFLIHGIRRQKAMAFPPRIKALEKLIEFVPKEPFYFLCHAKPWHKDGSFYHFDYAFLKSDFVKYLDIHTFWRYFDDKLVMSTQTIAVDLRKRKLLKIDSTKLDVLCRSFNIDLDHHNAKSDRVAMELLLGELRDVEKARTLFN